MSFTPQISLPLVFGVYCVLLVLSLNSPYSHWLNSVSFVLPCLPVELSGSSLVVLLWSDLFLFPSLVLLLFPLLVLFGIVRPSVGLVSPPSLVSVSIPAYLLLLVHCLLCVLVKVGDGMGDGF